ncbi:MAG: GIY-YIG nuclease family protein, partial [Planctomycetota bacterium]
MSDYYVYILANRKKGALYVGMAKDLDRRIFEHKKEIWDGFTRKYKIKKLVYYEKCEDKKTAG